MTVANSTPNSEGFVERVECLSWLAEKVINVAEVGERHGFSAPVACFSHQAQRFAVTLDSLAPRVARPFGLELRSGGVGTLGGYASAICVSRSPQFFESQ